MASNIDRVKAIFVEALELTGAQRLEFLDRACAGDAELRAEVDKFLRDEEQASQFFFHPGLRTEAATLDPIQRSLLESKSTVIGRYKILKLIGEGGFGSVFVAEQQTPVRRRVALKIIKLGMDTRQVIARFEAERQVLALLDHPNIAKVLDAGESETGRPYFVMELVDGIPITQYCDQNKLPNRQRLELFICICQALQHAHQKGIIHRDIKPNNILVAEQDGKPIPKLIDFGIAKATEPHLAVKTLLTDLRQLIGTPVYMSPEQVEMNAPDVDTRSDIYSLGVLLYELLTGTTPFSSKELGAAALGEMQRIVRDVDPPKPSSRLSTLGATLNTIATNRRADPRKLSLQVRGELDWIVMKALEKDKKRRYESAGEFSRDIARHLADEAVEARPPSRVYLVKKFYRRHRRGIAVSVVFTMAALVAAISYVLSLRFEQRKTEAALRQVRIQRNAALASEIEAKKQFVSSAIAQARGGRDSQLPGRRFDSLKTLESAAKIDPSLEVRSQAAGCLVLADLRLRIQWHAPRNGLCANRDCTLFADIDPVTSDMLIDRAPVTPGDPGVNVFRVPAKFGSQVQFSPDDRFVGVSDDSPRTRVYSLDGSLFKDIPSGPAFDFLPQGTGLAVANDGGPVAIYDFSSTHIRTFPNTRVRRRILLSPDGNRLVSWQPYTTNPLPDFLLCDLQTGKSNTLSQPDDIVDIAWHPSGNRLAVGCVDHNIYQWDVSRIDHPVPLRTLEGHINGVTAVQFSHGGTLLASSAVSEGRTWLWDAISGQPLVRINGGQHLNFSSDDRLLALSDYHHALLDVEVGSERRTFNPPPGRDKQVSFNTDGSLMACGGDGVIRFWNLTNPALYIEPLDVPLMYRGKKLTAPDDTVADNVYFLPDGSGLVFKTHTRIWKLSIREETRHTPATEPTLPRQIRIDPQLTLLRDFGDWNDGMIQVSSDGHQIACAHYRQNPRMLNLDDPSKDVYLTAASKSTMFISISPDQKWVATGLWASRAAPLASIWEARTGRKVCDLPLRQPMPAGANVAFTPNGKWLITNTNAGYQFWEVGNWVLKKTLPCEFHRFNSSRFSHDSQMWAMTSGQFGTQLLDPNTAAEWVTLDDLDQQWPLTFSPDNTQLATEHLDGSVQLWNLRQLRAELAEMGLDWPAPPIPPGNAIHPVNLSIASLAR